MRIEIRVYVLKPSQYLPFNIGNIEELTDDKFQEEAENAGLVYTLPNFQETFNEGLIDSDKDYIRIFKVEIEGDVPEDGIPTIKL